jgi:hypothetical protein
MKWIIKNKEIWDGGYWIKEDKEIWDGGGGIIIIN